MNKIRADQALTVIGSIEENQSEIEQIAEQEINLISTWRDSEITKLQKKISWLCFQLERYIRSTDTSTINLAHGAIKLRKSRDKLEIIDLQKFIPIGQRLGLLRRIEEKFEPDMNAIRAYLKINGNRPPSHVILTPGQPNFSYTANWKGSSNGESERTETEAGDNGTEQTSKVQAAA
jgi:phage host-nuclease inhibitor protein Gam